MAPNSDQRFITALDAKVIADITRKSAAKTAGKINQLPVIKITIGIKINICVR